MTAGVTTRHGGVSRGVYASLNLGDHVGDDPASVRRNRDLVARSLGVDRLTFMDQKHKSGVAVVTAETAGRGHAGDAEARANFPETDALVTDVPGVALAVMVADCAPVVLVDAHRGAAGVAHCGRGGTLLGVLPAAIRTMVKEFGTDPADLLVGVGPCIGADSYEIGPTQVEQVTAAYPELDVMRPTGREGHCSLDLVTILRAHLRDAGVRDEHVELMDIDTLKATDTFFSDRAQRPCGRFAGVVRL